MWNQSKLNDFGQARAKCSNSVEEQELSLSYINNFHVWFYFFEELLTFKKTIITAYSYVKYEQYEKK